MNDLERIAWEADRIIAWTSLILTGFTILVAVLALVFATGAFFGLRSLGAARKKLASAHKETSGKLADVHASLSAARDSYQEVSKQAKDWEAISAQRFQQIQTLEESWQKKVSDLDGTLDKYLQSAHELSRGERKYSNGDYQGAIECFSAVHKFRPTSIPSLYRMGRSYTNLEMVEEAQTCFETMLEISPENTSALRGLALNFRRSDFRSALGYAERATKADANDPRNWNVSGLLRRDEGAFEESLHAHERALSLAPKFRVTYFYIGLVQASLHRTEAAQESLGKAVEGLDGEERFGRVKPLWASVLRWADAILRGDYDAADEHCQLALQRVASSRRAQEVSGHFGYMLRSLRHEELIQRYVAPFDGWRI